MKCGGKMVSRRYKNENVDYYYRGSLEDGYILHFFHSYRYVLATKDVLAFITEKYNAAKE